MKNPLFIIFNDMHLTADNGQAILKSIDHMFKYAVENNIENIIFAGDAFVSRSAQRLKTFEDFEKIINKANALNITLYIIPGNHDKTDYKSFSSFLDIYQYHPSVKFFKTLENVVISGTNVTLCPFFDDEVLIPILNEAVGGDILISHFEMLGSENLGVSSNKDSITQKMLKKWKKVFLGHYHDTHEISKDIIHLPSLRQTKFSENTNKGFTVIYDDFSYNIIKGVFREWIEQKIDLDKTSLKEVKGKINKYKNKDAHVRFEFSGSESKLKTFDKKIFENTGIQVKTKFEKEFEVKHIEAPNVIKKYDEKQILEKLKIFCVEKGYDFETGLKYFKSFMNERQKE